MKGTMIKGTLALGFAALAASFRALAAPLILLAAVMLIDYVTGMARAWMTRSFSSRVGLKGIVKKLMYPVLVAVGMTADYLTGDALAHIGVALPVTGMMGLTVTLWLIINELISILENLADSSVPVPEFLLRLIARLKAASEEDEKK